MFEAKRISNSGSDFALDDIVIPLTDCDASPLYPPSVTSTATGNNPLLYTLPVRSSATGSVSCNQKSIKVNKQNHQISSFNKLVKHNSSTWFVFYVLILCA